MATSNTPKKIAILGGGPSALFLLKKLVEHSSGDFTVDIFEATSRLGSGMPYSEKGANREHITNVSGNEIPELVTPLLEWLHTLPKEILDRYGIDPASFTEFKVLPRLLFGDYLAAQFDVLLKQAQKKGISTCVHLESRVTDIVDNPDSNSTGIEIEGKDLYEFDNVIVCTGHKWPLVHEGKIAGYFDSPYPPQKLQTSFDHPIAIRGSSLTAIDGIRTLARCNGRFIEEGPHKLSFVVNEDVPGFKMIMHSRQGLLPGIRFHLEDSHLSKDFLLSKEDIFRHIVDNDGFLSLDFLFEKNFKDAFRTKDPAFYERIKDMSMEQFVKTMMDIRERADPFQLFKSEYQEAADSIRRETSVYWKEMLAVLSFAMNYPAKHFSAEDMLRLQQVLMPIISIVIAFVPQSSCEEMIALHEAGRLEIIAVGDDSKVVPHPQTGIIYHYASEEGEKQEVHYKTFIDCIGQRHLSLDNFPFKSLVDSGTVSAARVKFRSAENGKAAQSSGNNNIQTDSDHHVYLKVPGIAITDTFRVIETNGTINPRIYIMSVPYIGGYNPDYSGLDFCEAAAEIIVGDIFSLPGV